MVKTIYLDTSATTPLDKDIFDAMTPFFLYEYGNAGSMHHKGLCVSHTLNICRDKVAKILNANSKEIFFTGSGTESINLAIRGIAYRNRKGKNHIVTTNIEHHAVLDTVEYLEKDGFEVTIVPVEKNGIVDPQKINDAIKENTILVSVMYVNNEIGTIQPIKEIASICHEKKVIFHTDACQAANALTLDVEELGCDMLSLNGSKMYGPKGVGVLYKKRSVMIDPIITGGGQENGLRSGTENIPLIVGFTKALESAQSKKDDYNKRLIPLRDYLIEELLKIPNTILNGDKDKRVSNNVNVTFLNIEGEAILLMLDRDGICASSGSACTSKSLDPSYVILALGRSYEVAHGSIRFTLGKSTTKEDIDKVIAVMPDIVKYLREISPVHLKMEDI